MTRHGEAEPAQPTRAGGWRDRPAVSADRAVPVGPARRRGRAPPVLGGLGPPRGKPAVMLHGGPAAEPRLSIADPAFQLPSPGWSPTTGLTTASSLSGSCWA